MIKLSISYNRLWKLLIDKKMSKADLRRAAEISPNTILKRICEYFGCSIGDICDFAQEKA